MAFTEPTNDIEVMRPPEGEAQGFNASSAVTAGQVVKLDGDNDCTPADTNGEVAYGVATQTVASGDLVQVNGSGARVRFTAGSNVDGSNITNGDPLTVDQGTNNGEVQVADSTGDHIIGYAQEGATSQGDVFIGVVDRGGEVN